MSILPLDDEVIAPFIDQTSLFWENVSPNLITVSGIVIGGITNYLVIIGSSPLWIGTGLFFRWSTDVLDGNVARKYGKTSTLGGYLDTLADGIFLSTVPISLIGSGVVVSGTLPYLWCIAFFFFSLYHLYNKSWNDHALIKENGHLLSYFINRTYLVYLSLFIISLFRY